MNANGQAVLGPMEGRSHLRLASRREATSSRDSRVNDKAGKARREKPVSTCLTSKVACQSLAVTYVTTWHRAPSCAERTMVRPAALPHPTAQTPMPTREQLLEIYVFLARAVERHWHKGAVAFGITA